MRARRSTKIIGSVAALAMAAALTACSGDSDTIRIGVKYDQPGLGLDEGGTPVGFDVDVATYIAEHLGYTEDQIEWSEAASANRESFLQQGTVDMILATYSITDERREVVDFAGPYYVAQQDILTAADDTDIESPEDLDGKVLCSASGSRSANNIVDDMGIGAELREAGNYSECLELLSNGTVAAVTTDNTILAGFAAQNPGNYRMTNNPFGEEQYGVGLPKGSTERCEEINEAITQMWDDGSAAQFLEDAFGETDFAYEESTPELAPCA
ncbi:MULTISPECIES: glutamate ABC transporter substrate-binding protein [Nocardiopsis]|jgi:glutamate transport system substrate-binding protein|uniref:Glutamate ABC transporter substrate-binding protein n=2 Tax=Nocardiopsis alba TaxID=53437 RepID=A0A7K2IWU1_9ACTN|nr:MULTISPECIES: glutamate ABC transporter substrate-binding protein [Nocardiopsis]AFR08705.1 bacterial extracellular solute-binding s, 3 family protein [Nocardiopsis alba ATCC BAA-2165]MEC3892390.1 glutamate ABC transporter substrate-binding protein [Nocardiopsis sp. LDBS1602]MYR34255.1 transporter substrate-binding domain-containing protein [Nocardiopsis alba]